MNLRARISQTSEQGFTLVELMVVIVIIGLAATAVVLMVPDPGGGVATEAERFAARAHMARQSAITESRPFALALDATGYRIERRAGGEWQELARQQWSEGTRPDLVPGVLSRARFDSTGLAEPFRLVLRRSDGFASVEIAHNGSIRVQR
ncbi:MAG: GspH/FimT family pseudopilin [Sphingosinicella sp.]